MKHRRSALSVTHMLDPESRVAPRLCAERDDKKPPPRVYRVGPERGETSRRGTVRAWRAE